MTKSPDSTPLALANGASAAVGNLRAALVLLVLSIHSMLAYLSFLPKRPPGFTDPHFLWRSFPIIDTERFLGFDLYCAWVDIFVMSLFFFVSGLFVWQSLRRKTASRFFKDRAWRLGLPFVLAVALLMPVAQVPVYLQTAAHPGLADYVARWRGLPFWPAGPLWFLWVLLAGDVLAATLFCALPSRGALVLRLSSFAANHPGKFLAALLAISALFYVPLALTFGPLPWVQFGPLSFQLSRPGLYAVYFFAGVAAGANGLEGRLIGPQSILIRHWKRWLVGAVLTFALWLGLSAKAMTGPASFGWHIADAFSFPLACFANGFFMLGSALRYARRTGPWLESLNRNAYGIYLVHYLFIVWLQFALLPLRFPAVPKAAIVFAGTCALSWAASAAFRRLSRSAVLQWRTQ